MNQTKKRLSIIKLAISITDLETIQLQILKLLPLQADTQLQEVLMLLQTDNYAQAQSLITLYIETAPEEVVQRTPVIPVQETDSDNTRSEKEALAPGVISAEDQAIIDEFQLIVSNAPEPSKKNEEIDINDFLSYVPETTEEDLKEEEELTEEISETEENVTQEADKTFNEEKTQEENAEHFEKIFSAEKTFSEETTFSEVDTSYEDSDLSGESSEIESSTEDSFFAPVEEVSSPQEQELEKSEDDFFNLDTPDEVFHEDEEKMFKEKKPEAESETLDEAEEEKELHNDMDAETQALFDHVQEEENLNTEEEEVQETSDDEDLTPLSYEAMPHISLKLIDMKRRYPAIQKTYEKFENIESFIQKVAKEGYSEAEIQEALESTKTLIADAQYTQAAQLLLVCAATESKFAQFMLARELYVGSVLSKNIPESFALMSALAIDDYPEALCDLGQFYENGIATKVDRDRAEELYQGAVNAGIQRANKHYSRLTKSNRGFFKS